jgi:hypothetical protein
MVTSTLQESVKQKAYENYLKRGGTPGNDQEDWYKAEKEVLNQFKPEKSKEAATMEKKESRKFKATDY